MFARKTVTLDYDEVRKRVGLEVLKLWTVLGKNPSAKQRREFRRLSYFKGWTFRNEEGGPLKLNKRAVFLHACKAFLRHSKPSGEVPVCIPSVKVDLKVRSKDSLSVIWLGHSSLLIQSSTLNILVDPILSPSASPFPGAIHAFEGTQIYQVEDFPPIDYLVVTHDHYDHLDYDTVRALRPLVRKAVVPLGVGGHLRFWGYAPEQIIELGLFEKQSLTSAPECASSINVSLASITATPSRHISGRSLFLGRTLWASFVLEIEGKRLFLGGDGGYGPHFQKIGERFGPFDLAFLENGQYNVNWPNNHMFPEQVLQAARDLSSSMIFPIHWGKFCLSNHRWNAPIQTLVRLAGEQNRPVTVPRMGARYVLGNPPCREAWWLET